MPNKHMPNKDSSSKLRLRNDAISRRHIVGAGVRLGLGAIAAPAVLRAIPASAQSRVIKIGHVSPKTGPLAGFGEADAFVLDQVRGILVRGLQSGGRTYQVQIISKDSQSSGSRAAEVASELILGDKVDLIVASATPDTTNPVADQAEVNETPCITTNCPWQPYFFGRKGDPAPSPLFQQPGAGHMVGMDMGLQRIGEAQAELFDQRRVAAHLLEYRVDDDRRSAAAIGKEVGVGRGRRIEQLPENQHREPPMKVAAYGTIAG